MKTLYLECTSGISGDMTVAALLDLGADEKLLRRGLASLGVDGYEIEISRVKKAGISACDFNVILESERRHHEHAHEHNHPHEHPHADEHAHGHSHADEHAHDHMNRNLSDIIGIIDAAAEISENAKQMAKEIFEFVARAEAAVHGVAVDKVHFHEVGAVDSIVDIVGAAICLDDLQFDRIICSPLREGTGTVRCQHGVMPVPAPATLEIVAMRGIPLMITDNVGEMVTPTGAAIVAAVADSFETPKSMKILYTGYGAGKREFKTANLLRAMCIETETEDMDSVLLLECNLDDMTGEQLGYACEKLLEVGALDVWCTPITMKKSRPAQMLSLLCSPWRELEMTQLLFEHTSTIGVRVSTRKRHIMRRSTRTVETDYGPVILKDCVWGDVEKTTIEYESARKAADSCMSPIDAVYRAAYNK